MSISEDDPKDAIEEAEEIIRESRQISFHAPLRILYHLGTALAFREASLDEIGEESPQAVILRKFAEVVPEELIELGSEDFHGDMKEELPILLSDREIGVIAEAVFALPDGNEIVRDFNLDPQSRAVMNIHKKRHVQSFLFFLQIFTQNGGPDHPELILRGMQELDKS